MRIVNAATESPTAPLRMKLEVSEQFAKVFFSASDWNAVVRAGLKAGGEAWIASYLPLRFTGYARSQLGYDGKKRVGSPLVKTGNLQQVALAQSWVESRATSNNASLTLHITTGATPPNKNGSSIAYGQQPLVYRTLTTITGREIEFIANVMEQSILRLIEGADPTVSRKGTVRGKLTQTQRAGIQPTKRQTLAPSRRVA